MKTTNKIEKKKMKIKEYIRQTDTQIESEIEEMKGRKDK